MQGDTVIYSKFEKENLNGEKTKSPAPEQPPENASDFGLDPELWAPVPVEETKPITRYYTWRMGLLLSEICPVNQP